MIRLEKLGISFDDHERLLQNVDLNVPQGQTFVLIGPSGFGKSVLLKMVAGLISPSQGHIFIDGRDLHKSPRQVQKNLMQKMGMLFQKNALFDSFTVGDNLAFPLRETSSLSENEIKKKVKQFLEYVELSHAENLYPDEISGGMQKRVGIARALILNPQILFYDDPTAGLDPITSKMIIELIIRLNKEFGTTVMAITNDMNRAFQMADQIGIILERSLLITGTVEETKKHSNPMVQQFIYGRFSGPLTDGLST